MPLLSTTRRSVKLSPPLPVVNSVLAGAGLSLRRGQFSLLAGAPGTGKSVVATNLAVFTKVPVLFFSADSDEWTVRTRACAILSGSLLDDVEKNLHDEAWESFYADTLRAADHIDFCYQTDIDIDFLVLRLQAHAEMRGDYPHLVVVDNLANTIVDQDNEFAELRAICRELQRIARTTGAHIIAAHHVVGTKENGDSPVALADVMGKISKIPEVVLGLSHNGENSVILSVPKNRGGKAGLQIQLPLHYPSATVGGFR
jgi:predicted ATP-dependent serine protease